jgi:hypothetical protein
MYPMSLSQWWAEFVNKPHPEWFWGIIMTWLFWVIFFLPILSIMVLSAWKKIAKIAENTEKLARMLDELRRVEEPDDYRFPPPPRNLLEQILHELRVISRAAEPDRSR